MKIIYAIPGLGTTRDLFMNISVPGYELRVLEWPKTQAELNMADYAALFLEQIRSQETINLIGVSFGGMLCAELAERLPVNKVFLISSSKNRLEFPFSLRLLKLLPIYRLFPDKLIRLVAKTKRRFLGFEKSFAHEFFAMIDQMPKDYFMHCIRYIINWNRTSNSSHIVQIHGTSDRLLLYKKAEGAYAIKGGSHSMVLARANEINTILNTELNGTPLAS